MIVPTFAPNQVIISSNDYELITNDCGYLEVRNMHEVNSGWPNMSVTYATSYSKAGVTMTVSSENIETVKDAADYAEVITRAAIAYSVISVEVLRMLA
jgi:hypothetical protein